MKLTTIDQQVGRFIEEFRKGIDAWRTAGVILIEMVEADPKAYDLIIERCPSINAQILGRFEAIGRGTLHPQLLLDHSPGCAKLATLPLSVQQRYAEEPIPVVVEDESGTDILLMKAKDMTREQANQVFGSGRIRTESEQKAWIINYRSKRAKPVVQAHSPYTIRNGRVEFAVGTSLSARDLANILAQLTK
jgi:hypothetical protein